LRAKIIPWGVFNSLFGDCFGGLAAFVAMTRYLVIATEPKAKEAISIS